jgi:HNH endonuclease
MGKILLPAQKAARVGRFNVKDYAFQMFVNPVNVLANRWFQPLTHVSSGGGPRVCGLSCQRRKRGKRVGQRSAVAHSSAQYVPGVFCKQIGPERGCRLNPALTAKPVVEVNMAASSPKRILPVLEGRNGPSIIERFWAKVERRIADECWPWTASLNSNGYGRFKLASYEQVTASRVALAVTTGVEPEGMHALHSCDNPRCCNPAHLRWGTTQDNMRDKIERGRVRNGNQSGFSNPRARLTPEHLAQIVDGLHRGLSNKQIAEGLPIGHSMVSRIRVGISYPAEAAALGWTPTNGGQRK